MGDMGDFWNDVKEASRRHRDNAEPRKKVGAEKELRRLGWTVFNNDPYSFSLIAPNGKNFNYWYFKEYFQEVGGKLQGHGFRHLCNAGKVKEVAR